MMDAIDVAIGVEVGVDVDVDGDIISNNGSKTANNDTDY